MELKELLLWIIASILVLNYLLSMSLSILNLLNLSETQPDELKQYYDEERYKKKSQQYEREKSRFGMISETVMFIISFFFLILVDMAGLMVGCIASLQIYYGPPCCFWNFALFSDLLSIPFSLLFYLLELRHRYGFNKTTLAVFISDRIKGYFSLQEH